MDVNEKMLSTGKTSQNSLFRSWWAFPLHRSLDYLWAAMRKILGHKWGRRNNNETKLLGNHVLYQWWGRKETLLAINDCSGLLLLNHLGAPLEHKTRQKQSTESHLFAVWQYYGSGYSRAVWNSWFDSRNSPASLSFSVPLEVPRVVFPAPKIPNAAQQGLSFLFRNLWVRHTYLRASLAGVWL